MSLAKQTQIGLREMPSNAAWLVSRVLKPGGNVTDAAESTIAGVRDRRRKLAAEMVDAAPVGGDSVNIRMRRAQEAGARAREAEDHAVAAAQESKASSNHARDVSQRGRAYLREVEREIEREIKQRVGQAQKAADDMVRRERTEAEAEAEERRQEARAEVEQRIEDANREAAEAQQQAEELVEQATERLAEARHLAAEAASAAREVADEAHRHAQHLAADAEQQAEAADAQVKAAEQLRERSEQTAKETARQLQGDESNADLGSYRKPELVELAASMGIEKPTTMSKPQLVATISKASRAAG